MPKTFQELLTQTRAMIAGFAKIEQRPWGVEGSMLELAKQVGDLAKRVMVVEKYYLKSREINPQYQASTKEVADELFDIWFCLVRIADHYSIDFETTIDEITQKEIRDLKSKRIT